jgi:hypothetical protein
MPPAFHATTGFSFQRASETTSPNPSRNDFWITTSHPRWNIDLHTADTGEVRKDKEIRIVGPCSSTEPESHGC